MKRPLSALLVAVLGGGLALVGTAAPAAAHDTSAVQSIGGSCLNLDVALSGYATDPGAAAVTEERLVTPAVAEVSHTDYEYEKLKWEWTGFLRGHWVGSGEYRWTHKDTGEKNWYDWEKFRATGNTQKHIETPGQDAVYETVVVTPERPANATPNTVTVEIDGTVVAEEAFGEDFTASFPLDDKFSANDYTVTVAGYEGIGSAVLADTVEPCAVGDFQAAGTVDVDTVCEVATVALTNEELVADRINGTYSAVVYANGTAIDFLAPAEGDLVTRDYTLEPGTELVVRTGPAHDDIELARGTVVDCDPAVPAPAALGVTGALVPGGAITVTGTGFPADTELALELRSTPAALGSVTTDAEGAFSFETTLPADATAGEHTIAALQGQDVLAEVALTIAAAPVEPGEESGEPGTQTPGTETPGTEGTETGGTETDGTGTEATGSGTGTAAPAATGDEAADAESAESTGLASTGVEPAGLAALALGLLALAAAAFFGVRTVRARA